MVNLPQPNKLHERGEVGIERFGCDQLRTKALYLWPSSFNSFTKHCFSSFSSSSSIKQSVPFGYVEKTWVQSHTDRCKRYGIGDIRRVVTCVPFGLTLENFYICMLYRGFEESMVGGLTSNQKGVDRAL